MFVQGVDSHVYIVTEIFESHSCGDISDSKIMKIDKGKLDPFISPTARLLCNVAATDNTIDEYMILRAGIGWKLFQTRDRQWLLLI